MTRDPCHFEKFSARANISKPMSRKFGYYVNQSCYLVQFLKLRLVILTQAQKKIKILYKNYRVLISCEYQLEHRVSPLSDFGFQ